MNSEHEHFKHSLYVKKEVQSFVKSSQINTCLYMLSNWFRCDFGCISNLSYTFKRKKKKVYSSWKWWIQCVWSALTENEAIQKYSLFKWWYEEKKKTPTDECKETKKKKYANTCPTKVYKYFNVNVVCFSNFFLFGLSATMCKNFTSDIVDSISLHFFRYVMTTSF